MEEEWKHPALTAGLLFGVAKAYSIAQGVEVPVTSQLLVCGLLGASAYVSRHAPDQNPAVRALTTGSLFGGGMYALGNRDVLTYAVLGTMASYGADVIIYTGKASQPPETDEMPGIEGSTDHPPSAGHLGSATPW